ncbi:hypothetical protein MMC13_004085 [Lambiella insularis]|nr:hypothetical protein [Lambiella insularis]
MATSTAALDAQATPLSAAGVQLLPTSHPAQYISLRLSLSPHTTLHIHLTPLPTSTLLFLTTTDHATSASTSALGSFVYAMPNRLTPSAPLSTVLVPVPGTIDFATRVAKILARKTGKPTYVGCSVAFGGASVEEELQGVRAVVEAVVEELEKKEEGLRLVNGVDAVET